MDYKLKNFKIEFEIKRLANIQYFEFKNQFTSIKEFHPFNEMVYIDKGEILIDSFAYKGMLKEGEMIIHLTNQTHYFISSSKEPTNVVIIGFELTSDEAFKELSTTPFKLKETQKEYINNLLKEGRNIFLPPYDIPNLKDMRKKSNFEFGADQLIKNYLESFLILLIRDLKNRDRALNPYNENVLAANVKDYLDHYFMKNITISDLSILFNTNKTTLCKEFKKITSTTINKYINRLRIKQTKIYLREGNYTLTEISYIFNLSSVHYLTQLFKKYEGISPKEYKKSIKK